MTITTGNDARMFTCPMTMNGEPAIEEGFSGSRCNGEHCMAWRWIPLMANTPEYIEALKQCEGPREMKAKDAAAYVRDNPAEFGLPSEPFEGYCGLAGKP